MQDLVESLFVKAENLATSLLRLEEETVASLARVADEDKGRLQRLRTALLQARAEIAEVLLAGPRHSTGKD